MYKMQNNPCSVSQKAGYLGHLFHVPVGQRHDPISPCPLYLAVTLPKGILAAVPHTPLAQTLQFPSGVPCDGEREETPDGLHPVHAHVRSSHHLLTEHFSR